MMSNNSDISMGIIKKLLEDKISVTNIENWLLSINNCAQYYGLISENEELSQFQFITWFLNDLRIKAGQVINERKNKTGVSSAVTSNILTQKVECCNNSRKLSVSNESKIKTSEEVYLEEFPDLMELPYVKCHKSHRRIKPTSVQTDDECFGEKQLIEPGSVADSSSVPSAFNVSKEELLMQRFLKKKKIKKSSYLPLDINIAFTNKCNFKSFNINESRFKKIDKLVKLYSSLLKNCLVPNLTNEIKFILNMFEHLTENAILFTTKDNTGSDISFLSSIKDWEYFCVHIIIKEEYLMNKLDSNILKFIVNRLSLFTEEIPASYITNNADIILPQTGFRFYSRIFTGIKIVVDDFSNDGDYTLICEQEKHFLEIEKNWCSHRSDVQLGEEIKKLLNVSSQTIWFYFLGKNYVSCLIKKIEDQIINGSDEERKLAQLNTRLTKPSQTNEHEKDILFQSNEIFFKLWLDYCLRKCPLFIHYVKYWLIHALSSLTKDTYKELVDSLCPDKRNTHLWNLKVKIILAKFLGYTEFYFTRQCDKLNGYERKQLISIQSEILPAFDIKKSLLDAIKNGILVLTVPWIVEFLCMSDSISALLPHYHDVLFMLTTLYLSYSGLRHTQYGSKGSNIKKELLLKTSVLIPQRSFRNENTSNIEGITIFLNKSSFIFLLVWIGRLFDNKVFGESSFFDNAFIYQDKISQAKLKNGQVNWKTALDCADFVKRDVYIFCCPFFSKMKYWENSSSGHIRSIRPMQLDSENIGGSSCNIQDMLEVNFLSHHQSLAIIISFISERLSDVCQNEISILLSTNKSTLPCSEIKEENHPFDSINSSNLENNSSYCDSLPLLKPKIIEVITSCENKIKDSFSLLAPPGLSSSVMDACIAIASKQLERHIINWLVNEGFSLDSVKALFVINTNLKVKSCKIDENIKKNNEPLPCCTSLSSSISEINRLIRGMDKEKTAPETFYSILEKFKLISIQLHEIGETKLLKELYILSWDYTLLLVCNHNDIICDNFFTEMINFWKENHHGSIEERILCSRTIKEASIKTVELQTMIAKNLSKLMLLNLKDEMINCENFETQNIAVLRHTWTKVELLFIKTYMVYLCEYVKSSAISTPRLLSILDCLIDTIVHMLNLEN